MTIRPGTVGCHNVCKATTHLVDHHQHEVVEVLEEAHDRLSGVLIVELIRVNLFKHIATDGWVVCVAHNFASEEQADQWIRKAHSNCVDKNITW